MKPVRAMAVAMFLVGATWSEGRADSIVNFWLSLADTGPVAPVIFVAPGDVGQIQVWARPAEGYRMSAFSLDVTTSQPGIASFVSVDVLNPQLASLPPVYRHQIVFDSATGLEVAPDEIYGFLGYSFFEDALGLFNGAGVGPQCNGCSTASGAPSWHLATIEFQAGMSPGSVELFLSIGEQGLWQSPGNAVEPDEPSATSAIFGLPNDTVNHWAVLGEGTDHRHHPQGVADAVIQIATADFDQDDDVDGEDFLIWQRGLGIGSTLAEGDANGDGEVDGVDLAAWRFQFGASSASRPVGTAVPEPTGLIPVLCLIIVHGGRRRRRR